MNIVVITLPDFVDGEIGVIHQMFRQGLRLLHIRKPHSTIDELAGFIEQINKCYYSRITLHDHHALAQRYRLGGIHLNSRNPQPLQDWQGRLSRSCHSFEELQVSQIDSCGNNLRFDYQFLSPIYDSISKQGYESGFTHDRLLEASKQGVINQQVYALGGVTLGKIEGLEALGFGGAALLGEIWKIAQTDECGFAEYLMKLL